MKQFRLMLYVLVSSFSIYFLSCQTKPDKSFERIPDKLLKTEDLIKGILPTRQYEYWACFRQDMGGVRNPQTEIITSKGNISKLMNIKFNTPKSGFKNQMWRGYYYVAYIEKDSVNLVTNEKQLIRFLTSVNSIEEALLITSIKGFDVDHNRPIGSSFKKVKNGYELYLVKFHKCTVKTEPFKVYIDTLGNLKAKSLGFYYDVDSNTCLD